MPDQSKNQVIALAGIVQAISLVDELAKTGKLNEAAFDATIHSILAIDSSDILSVYGGLDGITYGLKKLIWLLTPPTKTMQTRMLLSVMRLQKKIFGSHTLIQTLTQRIKQAQKQAEYFNPTHPSVMANLADAYENVLHALRFSTSIRGNPRVLNVRLNMEKIRVLLLAGIRSSLLWRQYGGSKLTLIFYRKKIRKIAQEILGPTSTQIKLEEI